MTFQSYQVTCSYKTVNFDIFVFKSKRILRIQVLRIWVILRWYERSLTVFMNINFRYMFFVSLIIWFFMSHRIKIDFTYIPHNGTCVSKLGNKYNSRTFRKFQNEIAINFRLNCLWVKWDGNKVCKVTAWLNEKAIFKQMWPGNGNILARIINYKLRRARQQNYLSNNRS